MKLIRLLLLFLLPTSLLVSCSKDQDDDVNKIVTGQDENLEIEKFIYAGMNNIYLYKANVPKLADNYFSSQEDLNEFLGSFDSPEDLFYNGLVDDLNDRFSFIVDDYIELENHFSGISTTTGMNYGLSLVEEGSEDVIGYIRYVAPNSPAEQAGLERGDLFTNIDGAKMTTSNYSSLLGQESFTLEILEFQNGNLVDSGESADLTKVEYTENPVYIAKTIDVDGKKVGYLMYNSFVGDFDDELNAAFSDFKAEGVTDLILDLRYNGGGSVESAVDLASMITGQFEGEVFAKQRWNAMYQAYFEQENPDRLYDRFNTKIRTGAGINSLNLDQVFIIGTGSTASASELVINGLEPYIDVVHIGTNTVGKFQASVTLYDSDNFGRQNANPNHKYAIQPLVYKSENANGKSDFVDGLEPDVPIQEYVSTYGTLGDPSEPLLAAALDAVQGNRKSYETQKKSLIQISETGKEDLDYQKMYIDEIPEILRERN